MSSLYTNIVRSNNLIIPLASGHSSQTVTQNGGSSFESASSRCSLARVDALCDENSLLDDSLPLPPTPPAKIKFQSRSHSAGSSSSGSYDQIISEPPPSTKTTAKVHPQIEESPHCTSKVIVDTELQSRVGTKSESVSDDEKSEKRYSSSGYYESPHDDGKPKHTDSF